MADDGKFNIEPAGEAMKMAQKWLNQKGLRADMAAQAVTDAEQDKPRPQGLGLGAAFLPHHKGKLIAAGLDKHLMKRIQASQQPGSQGSPTARERQDRQQEESSSDDEGGGRAGAFVAKQQFKLVEPQQKYAIQPSMGVKKKLKKKKKKQKKQGHQPTVE